MVNIQFVTVVVVLVVMINRCPHILSSSAVMSNNLDDRVHRVLKKHVHSGGSRLLQLSDNKMQNEQDIICQRRMMDFVSYNKYIVIDILFLISILALILSDVLVLPFCRRLN